MMEVKLRNLGQTLSLDDGSTQNFLIIELPSGVLVRATISDEAVEEVTRTFVTKGGDAAQRAVAAASGKQEEAHPALHLVQEAAQRTMPEHRQYSPLSMTDDGAMEFGGDGGLAGLQENLAAAEAAVAHSLEDLSAASDVEVARAASNLRTASMPVPHWGKPAAPLRVIADERGNPIVQGANRVDMLDLTGGNTEGEEDVGSV